MSARLDGAALSSPATVSILLQGKEDVDEDSWRPGRTPATGSAPRDHDPTGRTAGARRCANPRTIYSEKLDRVEISDAGRARASSLEPTVPGTRERLAEVRRRVLTGAYNADAVVGEVARRIIDRGDV